MKNNENLDRINYLFSQIKKESAFDNFILNKKVYAYLKEIDEIQNNCKHEFKNGSCIYCLKEEHK